MLYACSRADWSADLQQGKMLGVLVVNDHRGQIGFLAAFSGILAGSNNHPYFVPPIYDLLNSDGEYKQKERDISHINKLIATMEQSPQLHLLTARKDALINAQEQEIEQYKRESELARERRHALRNATPALSAHDEALLTQESQFRKAELKRMRRRHALEREAIETKIAALTAPIDAMRRQRKAMSEALQQRLFELYIVSNARGEKRNVKEIFAQYALSTCRRHLATPPGGTGECCAPKLLQYAYEHGLQPVCMAEFWYGDSLAGEVRHHGHFYPACRSKCLPLLTFMLQGLNVEHNTLADSCLHDIEEVYDDPWLSVIIKPAGMLSEPGKLTTDSALTRYKTRHPEASGPVLVHRLDQETSGLLIFAKDKSTHKELQHQFAEHDVRKHYVALLDGVVQNDGGNINLPLTANLADRPRQVVDFERGKQALTMYRVSKRTADHRTWVVFTPVTGRTHQLRVHASHPMGLNCPIVGDMLYGTAASRLMLHAASISFIHPATGRRLTFRSPFPQSE